MIEKIAPLCALAASLCLHAAAQSTILPATPPAPAVTPATAATAVTAPAQTSSTTLTVGSLLAGDGSGPALITRLAKLSPMGDSPDWEALAAFAKTMTRSEIATALQTVYSDGGAFPPPWRMEAGALIIQTGDVTRPELSVELASRSEPSGPSTRYWHRMDELPPLKDESKPLTDLHIAIDPGHIGGSFGPIEERYLSFQPNEAIMEGNLTLATAQALAERLKELGAYVSFVRDRAEPVTKKRPADLRSEALQLLKEAGFPEPKEGYEGLTGDEKLLTVQWQTEKLFYRVSEIHARGKKVNEEIKPDLVLCLHYNAEAWGAATSPQYSPQNHFHVLVNGCYSALELEQADVRFEMFRRLLSRIHEEELPVADAVATGLRTATGLPPYVYTTPNARRVGPNEAVYARNLLANRIYNCPVVYLEPYVMNHEQTYRRLLNGHFLGRTLIAGKLQPSAIADYVRGVVDGLTAHYLKFRKPATP